MSKAKLTFSVNPAFDPDDDKFAVAQASGQATAEQALEWYKSTLPGHFTPAAPTLYPGAYAHRTAKYTERKQKKTGQNAPMVFSGAMRAAFLQGMPNAQAKGKKANVQTTLRFPFVRVVNLWRGNNPQHPGLNMYRELTEFNRRDAAVFEKGVQDRMPALVQKALANGSGQMHTETYEGNP